MLNIREKDGGVTLECFISPRASKNKIKGERNGALAIALTSPPIEGRANEELIEFLSEIFSVSKTRIKILRGQRGRHKLVFITNISKETVLLHSALSAAENKAGF